MVGYVLRYGEIGGARQMRKNGLSAHLRDASCSGCDMFIVLVFKFCAMYKFRGFQVQDTVRLSTNRCCHPAYQPHATRQFYWLIRIIVRPSWSVFRVRTIGFSRGARSAIVSFGIQAFTRIIKIAHIRILKLVHGGIDRRRTDLTDKLNLAF